MTELMFVLFKKLMNLENVWNSECHAKIGILHKRGIVEHICFFFGDCGKGIANLRYARKGEHKKYVKRNEKKEDGQMNRRSSDTGW